jgi:hypothetical protein
LSGSALSLTSLSLGGHKAHLYQVDYVGVGLVPAPRNGVKVCFSDYHSVAIHYTNIMSEGTIKKSRRAGVVLLLHVNQTRVRSNVAAGTSRR